MLLSICIPTTNGRAEVLEGTLKSILDANVDPEGNIFEIIISDNSEYGESFNVAQKYISLGLNIKYNKGAEKSFYNAIHSLKLAQGELIKLHNDYSSFNSGELLAMIQFIEAHRNTKEQILFTNGNLQCKSIKHLSTFNDFIKVSSYWHTWASSFSMWRDDFEKLDCSKDNLDPNFPHVSLLFFNHNKNGFIVNDISILNTQKVRAKGGYNLFKLFCVDYNNMLLQLLDRKLITAMTYRSIFINMRNKFIPSCLCELVYSENDFTFDNSRLDESLNYIYSPLDMVFVRANTYLRVLHRLLKRKIKI